MFDARKPFSLQLNPKMFEPATEAEKAYISRMRPSSTFFRDGCRRLLKNKVATLSLIVIILITIAVIVVPVIRCWVSGRENLWTAPTIIWPRLLTERPK